MISVVGCFPHINHQISVYCTDVIQFEYFFTRVSTLVVLPPFLSFLSLKLLKKIHLNRDYQRVLAIYYKMYEIMFGEKKIVEEKKLFILMNGERKCKRK